MGTVTDFEKLQPMWRRNAKPETTIPLRPLLLESIYELSTDFESGRSAILNTLASHRICINLAPSRLSKSPASALSAIFPSPVIVNAGDPVLATLGLNSVYPMPTLEDTLATLYESTCASPTGNDGNENFEERYH